MSFGKRLAKARTEKGYSQTELGDIAGVHYTQIGRYEKKGVVPAGDVLGKIANALGVTTDFLMSGTTNDQANDTLNDKELIALFKRTEELPKERKKVVKELLEAFLIKTELQQKFSK